MALFPYDLNELLGGRARILVTDDLTEPVPAGIGDILAMVSPYGALTGWTDIGATGGAAQYGRNLTVGGYNIQQTNGTVLEEPTDLTRSITFPAAEIRPDIIQMLEEGAASSTVAAAANKGAQDKQPFGTIIELTSRRIALVGQRKKAQGIVTEPGGATRGRLVALVGYHATISADNAQLSLAEGDMAQVPLSFTLHPESTITTDGAEYGAWFFEDAGTIAAS